MCNLLVFLKIALLMIPIHSAISSPIPKGGYFPAPLLLLDNYFTHHIYIAEKSNHKLYLFKNNNGLPEYVKNFQMATGKSRGDKLITGDHKTPEGIYFLTEFLHRKNLIESYGSVGDTYGVGAFVMNYPNPIDIINGKTGGGIWLHSTNDESRINKKMDSRGCLVVKNSDLIGASKYIQLNRTMIIVVQELNFFHETTWDTERNKLKTFLNSWLTSWQEENIDKYISYYHREFKDNKNRNITAFKNYKKNIFSIKGKPLIETKNVSILSTGKYSLINFRQIYNSSTINDIGRKTLYLKRNEDYEWKIISEKWSKRGIDKDIEQQKSESKEIFKPAMRFFNTENPKEIFSQNTSNEK